MKLSSNYACDNQMSIFDFLTDAQPTQERFYYKDGTEIVIGDTVWCWINKKPQSDIVTGFERRTEDIVIVCTKKSIYFCDVQFICKTKEECIRRETTWCKLEIGYICNIKNLPPIAKDLGMDCNGVCCWGCKERNLCGAACNASGKNIQHWQCYYCKHINHKKKKITGTRNHLYIFGCDVSENGYVPGGAVIGEEDKWLKTFGCGMFEENKEEL